MSALTDAEREALLCDCDNPGSDFDHCPAHGGNDGWWTEKPAGEIVAAVERILAARLAEHAEQIAAAIEAERDGRRRLTPGLQTFGTARRFWLSDEPLTNAARIARVFKGDQ